MERLYAGIEAGGTKFIILVGTAPDDICDEISFPTGAPEETLGTTVEFLQKQPKLAGIGIGTFGPADPNPKSPTFGYITNTPKPGWAYVDFAGIIQRELNTRVRFDTDVNAAALGEYQWGAGQGLDNFLYLTIGTGVGGGGMINGRLMHGLIHPEMGHMKLPEVAGSNEFVGEFSGICPYHGDCLEGVASGPAIAARWGMPATELAVDHPAWQLQTEYLSAALHNLICILSPQRIILGGGVMEQRHLFPRIRARCREMLNGYVPAKEVAEDNEEFICPPKLGGRAGGLGALALAMARGNYTD